MSLFLPTHPPASPSNRSSFIKGTLKHGKIFRFSLKHDSLALEDFYDKISVPRGDLCGSLKIVFHISKSDSVEFGSLGWYRVSQKMRAPFYGTYVSRCAECRHTHTCSWINEGRIKPGAAHYRRCRGGNANKHQFVGNNINFSTSPSPSPCTCTLGTGCSTGERSPPVGWRRGQIDSSEYTRSIKAGYILLYRGM